MLWGFSFHLSKRKSHCRISSEGEDLRVQRISDCCVENRLQGPSWKQGVQSVAIAEIQVKEDGGWNQGGSCVVLCLGFPT